MMGTRHLIAGTLLYAAMRWRGAPKPKPVHWVGAIVAGGFLFLGDHGLLAWAEQRVPSGLAALLSATLPFWMVAAARLEGIEPKLNFRALAGLAIGLAGVAFLVGPGPFGQASWGYLVGAGAILFGAVLWVVGSLYARGARLPDSPLLSAAMQMISGGALLVVAGTLIGEAGRIHMDGLTLRAMLSLAYLILFGSIVAFGSYVWLLRVSPPSRISTYAYVNPLVAVFLGWSMAGEAVTSRTIVAAALILIGVALVNTRGAADAAAEKESVAHKKNLTMRPDPLKKGLPENSEECT